MRFPRRKHQSAFGEFGLVYRGMLIIFRTLCGPMREFLVDPDDFGDCWKTLSYYSYALRANASSFGRSGDSLRLVGMIRVL